MILSLKIAKILKQLISGESIAASSAKSQLMDALISENIIISIGNHRKTLHLRNENNLRTYLINQLQINNLESYILLLENTNSSRSHSVKITTDSKKSRERAFKGFLVNTYHPINAELNHQKITINPTVGSFMFIYDFETFRIPEDVMIVGIENSKNFSQVHQQKHLFGDINPLFVSRYPQNQNKDFLKWMKSIPNHYLHFGDFDIAGIGIYLNEYKKHLAQRAKFFIPKDIKSALSENGNRERFNIQRVNFVLEDIQEEDLLELFNLINFEKKGLDQEYYIEINTI